MTPPDPFVPDRDDIIWIDMDPRAGHEQAGRRPALVLSPAAYNGKTGLAVLCPITRQAKGYPFEVTLPPDAPATGVVLADQVRNLDWRVRNATPHGRAPSALVAEVLAKLATLIALP
ncbi:MAG: endoribonuclease MazF [Longimicrobiales bacterium]|nr:endoribonuclease MazF [Longimicrobiales bacterium]